MKISWLDVRGLGEAKEAILQEALHHRVEGIVADEVKDLADLPPTVTKILFPQGKDLPMIAVTGAALILGAFLTLAWAASRSFAAWLVSHRMRAGSMLADVGPIFMRSQIARSCCVFRSITTIRALRLSAM